jgi:hypothetical protein
MHIPVQLPKAQSKRSKNRTIGFALRKSGRRASLVTAAP